MKKTPMARGESTWAMLVTSRGMTRRSLRSTATVTMAQIEASGFVENTPLPTIVDDDFFAPE